MGRCSRSLTRGHLRWKSWHPLPPPQALGFPGSPRAAAEQTPPPARPRLPHRPPFLPGEPTSSCAEIQEGGVRSWASCNPAEYFPGYLTKLLQNHTAYACDGDHLNLQCPRHSTISVQSAFYGQDYQMCSTQQPASQREDSLTCMAPTTLQVWPFLDAER